MTTKSLCILHPIQSSMKGPNTLKLTVTKIASGCVATSFVNSNDQLANIFTKSLRGLNTFVTNLVHITYMLQLEGEC